MSKDALYFNAAIKSIKLGSNVQEEINQIR